MSPTSRSLPPKWRIPLFLLLLLLPLGAAEVYVRSLPNPSKDKHAYLTRHSREVDLLVLGSSHTYYGLCPERLSPHAFSAAQVSQTLRYDDYLLRHYPFPRLRTVVLPISDFTLYEELENTGEWYLANRYRLYMDCDLHGPLSVYNWEVTAFRPFCEKLKSLWEKPKMTWSAQGRASNTAPRRAAPGGTKAQRQPCETATKTSPPATAAWPIWKASRSIAARTAWPSGSSPPPCAPPTARPSRPPRRPTRSSGSPASSARTPRCAILTSAPIPLSPHRTSSTPTTLAFRAHKNSRTSSAATSKRITKHCKSAPKSAGREEFLQKLYKTFGGRGVKPYLCTRKNGNNGNVCHDSWLFSRIRQCFRGSVLRLVSRVCTCTLSSVVRATDS